MLGHQRIGFLARGRQPLLVGFLNVIGEFRAPADVAQPVLTALHQQGAKLLLGLGGGVGFQGHPFDVLAPGVVLGADPGHKFAIAPPEAPNCVLAVIRDFDVSITA